MKVALAQINPVIADFPGNAEKILRFAEQARIRKAELVVFPELSLCGYPPMDLLDQGSFVDANLKGLRYIQQNSPKGIGILVGYVDRNRGSLGKSLVNAAVLMEEGRVLLTQHKTLLPTYDVFDEARYFEPAAAREVLPYRGERIGIAICEDIWWESEAAASVRYPVDPVKELLDQGASLLLVPSASPYYAGKLQVRHRLLSSIGRSSGVPVVYVNMVGGNDSLIFDGRSLVTSPEGALSFLGQGFEEELTVVDTRRPGPALPLAVDRYEELERALELGIRDYLAKCGFERVHLGLSGGIDSAVVAVLAARALGPERVASFALPSRYSSASSGRDADRLAANLGVALHTLSIEGVFAAGLSTLAPLFGDRAPDVTEENLQARIRGLLLMAYANKFRSLLLTTGNKSELATGYSTLYGDMCGVLAVIGDLFKTEVYALAHSLNRNGELIPASIIDKAPSAELRPDQTDQDTLPPYDTLDGILSLYLLDNKTGEEITAAGYDGALVHQVLGMVAKAEFKRRQAPPVLKVSPRAFGTGRRIPIARRIYEA
ncbi:MAG: NAD+ synthase [Spirochaetales bacterium]|nr:NAD+ synthase [Spirochaetales bacterium]